MIFVHTGINVIVMPNVAVAIAIWLAFLKVVNKVECLILF